MLKGKKRNKGGKLSFRCLPGAPLKETGEKWRIEKSAPVNLS